MIEPKPRPQHEQYLQVLRAMTPEQRLRRAFAMSDFTKALFVQGLRDRFPEVGEAAIHRLFLDRLAKCHNSNY